MYKKEIDMRRVVVTGMGAITPIGLNVEEFWNGVKESKVGIAPITKFDASEFKAKIAAEVKGFNAKDYIDPKTAKRMELFSQYAVVAAKEARQVLIWRRKIHTVSVRQSDPEPAVCRRLSGM